MMKKLMAILATLGTASFLTGCGGSLASDGLASATTPLTSQAVFATDAEAAKKAIALGYSKTNYRSQGCAVFYNSKTKSELRYITRDIDSHNGGAWKAASSVANLGSKNTRSGTYNADLTVRIGN